MKGSQVKMKCEVDDRSEIFLNLGFNCIHIHVCVMRDRDLLFCFIGFELISLYRSIRHSF